jgi:hypothetical protein
MKYMRLALRKKTCFFQKLKQEASASDLQGPLFVSFGYRELLAIHHLKKEILLAYYLQSPILAVQSIII